MFFFAKSVTCVPIRPRFISYAFVILFVFVLFFAKVWHWGVRFCLMGGTGRPFFVIDFS